MKSLITFLAGLGLLACHTPSTAQDEQRLRNDPTYSTHNYKHANKAAAAQRWKKDEGVSVQPPAPGDSRLANYKNQVPFQRPVGGVTVSHTPDEGLANRNYKAQNTQVRSSQDSTLARKRARKNDSDDAVGD